MTATAISAPTPCAPWCTKRGRKHRNSWDDIGRTEAARTCARRIGTAPTIQSGGHRYEIAVDRFEHVDFGVEHKVGPAKGL